VDELIQFGINLISALQMSEYQLIRTESGTPISEVKESQTSRPASPTAVASTGDHYPQIDYNIHSVRAKFSLSPAEVSKTETLKKVLDTGINCRLLILPPAGSRNSAKAYTALLRISDAGDAFILAIKAHRTIKQLVLRMDEVTSVNKGKGPDLSSYSKALLPQNFHVSPHNPIHKLHDQLHADLRGTSLDATYSPNADDDSFLHFAFASKPEVNLQVEDKFIRDSILNGLFCLLCLHSKNRMEEFNDSEEESFTNLWDDFLNLFSN
jgi:hypothetical protein